MSPSREPPTDPNDPIPEVGTEDGLGAEKTTPD